jgi:tRNA-splicing ligase RtcB
MRQLDAFGLFKDQVTILIHTAQGVLAIRYVTYYIREMIRASERYSIYLPDRQLMLCTIRSPEGQKYLSAMACAANYAFANRQMITHWVRESFERIFKIPASRLGLTLVYDVCHNIAKLEKHRIKGKNRELCVHRKGATRAFPKGHKDIPDRYKPVGQPVLCQEIWEGHQYPMWNRKGYGGDIGVPAMAQEG